MTVLAFELEPAARLLPPEKGGAGVEELEVLIVQVLDPDADHPAGNEVPVPKFWV